MPSDLQKTVLRHQQKQQEQQQRLMQDQPWWQYYYQRYHYHPPPGRKPTVFGPYLLLQTLGEGEFGKVKLGIHIESGHEVAIKLIKRDNIDSSTRMTKVEREISVLRTVRHPYIVKLYDVIETEKYIGIILQCASGGELFEYILAHRYLKEKDASRLFAQLISGVHYMHQKHIVHRDLKLENLLLDRHRSIIITDFGFANQFSSARDDLMSTSCGSPCYAAPELVISEGLYVGSAVDIWSCGVILYAMLCGYLPFDDDPANPDGDNINLLYKYILSTPLAFPDYVSPEARDLLRKMLVPDPAKRCSMEIIMNHPWLQPHKSLFETTCINTSETDKMDNDNIQAAVEQTSIKESEINSSTTTKEQEEEKEQQRLEQEEADSVVPELPQPSPSPSKRQSTSTDRILQFLSGNNNTPKVSRHLSTNSPPPQHRRPMSLLGDSNAGSILQAKFLSSIQRQHQRRSSPGKNQQKEDVTPSASLSASHIPTHQQQHLSFTSAVNNPSIRNNSRTPQPGTSQPIRGTRRKALSLLVNSMTDYISHDDQQGKLDDAPNAASMPLLPSVSEHTINMTQSTQINSKEKHRSAGKKLMDWFKKKPLSNMNGPFTNSSTHLHQNNNNNTNNKLLSKLPLGSYAMDFNDAKLRNHHGAVDQDALTARPPPEIFQQIKHTLTVMGMEIKRDGGDYKLKCIRKKRPNNNNIDNNGVSFRRRMLMRKSADMQSSYGDPALDPGDEVRFSVELCKIKNLPGLYIVDIRRLRGNLWSYKFLYHALLEQLNLSGNGGYISNQPPLETSQQRISMVSSSGASSSVVEEEEEEEVEENTSLNHHQDTNCLSPVNDIPTVSA
ncbi:kinase-like domain-containing protein [Halteromyces radiatus]|uniref:kinase-like domain-containing protein n=1 Tax=Halteromyces radiatus TaxID=101107 RepID=UPI00221E97D4|nr:kinase-like domain-containing protein [Halteromyces radiatus]KAI8080048.1 kinase-like domain-containing protein [Halteromyces radiatus]